MLLLVGYRMGSIRSRVQCCSGLRIGYAGCFMTEEFKAYRLQLIAEAAENVRRERELARQMSEDFSLDEVDCE